MGGKILYGRVTILFRSGSLPLEWALNIIMVSFDDPLLF